MRIVLAWAACSLTLWANSGGLPVGSTGAFGERTCAGALCHVPEPLFTGLSAGVSVEVGPYVPGATQLVRVEIISPAARRWGFQLTARRAGDTSQPAGAFASRNLFTAVRCPNGRLAPCADGEVEYATHTSVGSNGGGGAGRQIYGVDWTAPDADIGEVVFAVAALAADGDGGGSSDITTTGMARSVHGPSHVPAIRQGGVAHAASLQGPFRAIAPKQLMTLFGENFGAPGLFRAVRREDFDVRGLAPDELHRVSVVFERLGDRTRFGRLIFVGENQVNLQAPDFPGDLRNATTMIQAIIHRGEGANELRSNIVEVPVRAVAPGLFTLNSSGVGHVAAVDTGTGRLVAPASAGIQNSLRAAPGDVILVFGTGFGPTTPDFEPGQRASGIAPLDRGVTGAIGGVELTEGDIIYAGAAPQFVGLTQFNLRVPELPDGDHRLVLRSGTSETQADVVLRVERRL